MRIVSLLRPPDIILTLSIVDHYIFTGMPFRSRIFSGVFLGEFEEEIIFVNCKSSRLELLYGYIGQIWVVHWDASLQLSIHRCIVQFEHSLRSKKFKFTCLRNLYLF